MRVSRQISTVTIITSRGRHDVRHVAVAQRRARHRDKQLVPLLTTLCRRQLLEHAENDVADGSTPRRAPGDRSRGRSRRSPDNRDRDRKRDRSSSRRKSTPRARSSPAKGSGGGGSKQKEEAAKEAKAKAAKAKPGVSKAKKAKKKAAKRPRREPKTDADIPPGLKLRVRSQEVVEE